MSDNVSFGYTMHKPFEGISKVKGCVSSDCLVDEYVESKEVMLSENASCIVA